jgi:hypothetical protein
MNPRRFRIAFSFAGEKRDFVEQVADLLAARFGKDAILYDKYHEAEFARYDLGISLPKLYGEESDLIVPVLCPAYDTKRWTGWEWVHIYGLLTKDDGHRVMPSRFGHANADGLSPAAGFIELDDKTPEQFVTLILERLARNEDHPRDHYTKLAIDAQPQKPVENNDMKESTSDSSHCALRLNLELWCQLVERKTKLPDRLFHDLPKISGDEIVVAVDNLMSLITIHRLSAEVCTARDGSRERIQSAKEFWVLVLSGLVLNASTAGAVKWLIKETVGALKAAKVSDEGMITSVWTLICRRYCDKDSNHYREGVLESILSAAIGVIEHNRNAMYRFFSFLYLRLGRDLHSIQKVAERLTKYDHDLAKNVEPGFKQTLKRLHGVYISATTQGIKDIPPFRPHLVEIPPGGDCPYRFEAMVSPLTVMNYSSIKRIPPQDVGDNPNLPYVFKIGSEGQEALSGHQVAFFFISLKDEVQSLVDLCNMHETSDHFRWDIPTVCEWLALADCQTNLYPWGNEDPTRAHANLSFNKKDTLNLKPVGSYSEGDSRHGTQDCCGNVHEIVRISSRDRFPHHFRLMGGCYQTYSTRADCQIIRQFRTKQKDNRRNVGLRLVRFDRKDIEIRWQALAEFLRRRKRMKYRKRGASDPGSPGPSK